MLPRETSILIVGAGPVGLALALSLSFQGHDDFVVVEAVEKGAKPTSSRAIVMHCSTIEVLESLEIAQELVGLGVKANHARLYGDSGLLSDADFDYLKRDTRHPYILLVSQYTTEQVLEKKAEERGIKVERPYRLVGLSDSSKDESVVATFDNGERIRAKYVIGADGSHSVVRQLVNLDFADPDGASIDDKYVRQMVLADISFSPPPTHLTRDQVSRYTSETNFYLTIPVPRSRYPEAYDSASDSIYRIEFNIPKEDGPPPPSPDVAYFQKHLDRILPKFLYPGKREAGVVKIDKVYWSTRFRTHSAIAEKYSVRLHERDGNQNQALNPRIVFIIGDAAHIHSPIGGQGMNLGLRGREAIGLAPVLMKHIKLFPHDPSSADKLLEEYGSMRHERALKTIYMTKRTMGFMATLGALAHGWRKYLGGETVLQDAVYEEKVSVGAQWARACFSPLSFSFPIARSLFVRLYLMYAV